MVLRMRQVHPAFRIPLPVQGGRVSPLSFSRYLPTKDSSFQVRLTKLCSGELGGAYMSKVEAEVETYLLCSHLQN